MSTIVTPVPAVASRRRTIAADSLLHGAVWLLPVYGLLLTLGTLTHQPDFRTDFPGYAEYVTTGKFLAGHLGASIAGAALGAVAIAALVALLARGPAARSALGGGALFLAGTVVTASVFGAAAFAQPAIGDAYLSGAAGMPEFNDAVYGTPLMVTAGAGMLLLIAGSILLGRAVRASAPELRVAGTGFAIAFPLFVLLGPPGVSLQPAAAAAFAVAGLVIARRLR